MLSASKSNSISIITTNTTNGMYFNWTCCESGKTKHLNHMWSWYFMILDRQIRIFKTQMALWIGRLIEQCDPGPSSRCDHISWFLLPFCLKLQRAGKCSPNSLWQVWKWFRTRDPLNKVKWSNHSAIPTTREFQLDEKNLLIQCWYTLKYQPCPGIQFLDLNMDKIINPSFCSSNPKVWIKCFCFVSTTFTKYPQGI